MDKTKTRALIVFRHADDNNASEYWETNDGKGFDYALPNGDNFHLDRTRLNKKGKKQAQLLGSKLPEWMKDDYLPFGRVITQQPIQEDGVNETTPNPFCTVHPVIDPKIHSEVRDKPLNVIFYGSRPSSKYDDVLGNLVGNKDLEGLISDIKKNASEALFSDEDYSTLICMTREDMWSKRKASDGQKYPSKETENLFINIVDESNKSVWEKLKIEPEKCRFIYVFTNLNQSGKFENLEVYTLHMSNGGSITLYKKGDSLKGQ